MDLFSIQNTLVRKKNPLRALLWILLLLSLFFCSACKEKINYFDYVSELRSNIYLAEKEGFSLRVYATSKESPYAADGIPEKISPRFEAYLIAPNGTETVELHFTVDGRAFGGEMSYDVVKGEYFYSCTLDCSALTSIDCTLLYGERELTLTAVSVLEEGVLTPKAVLDSLVQSESALFTAMTDEYGFSGEIYLRLIFEDSPYYYVGVISRTSKVTAFLLNAKTGAVLAKREG